MNPVNFLREGHAALELELSELEFIMDSDIINYSNLVHTFRKISKGWDAHEKVEENLFDIMKSEGFEVPIETILLEHKDLEKHVQRIRDAINSGSDAKVRDALALDMRAFIGVLRKHIDDEDEILIGVLPEEFSVAGKEAVQWIISGVKE